MVESLYIRFGKNLYIPKQWLDSGACPRWISRCCASLLEDRKRRPEAEHFLTLKKVRAHLVVTKEGNYHFILAPREWPLPSDSDSDASSSPTCSSCDDNTEAYDADDEVGWITSTGQKVSQQTDHDDDFGWISL